MIKASAKSTIHPGVWRKLGDNVQSALNETASEAASRLAQGVKRHKSANGDFEPTGASAASIYLLFGTRTGHTTNYREALAEYQEAFLAGDIARTPERRAQRLKARTLKQFRLPARANTKSAGVASLSRVVWWWETGHHNQFTGAFEYDPAFALIGKQMKRDLLGRMEGVLGRGSARVTIQRQDGLSHAIVRGREVATMQMGKMSVRVRQRMGTRIMRQRASAGGEL